MCTVTYLPVNQGSFILTSSRDEISGRGHTVFPVIQEAGSNSITFAQDPLRGGTWLACNDNGKVCCLLNGAFDKHPHVPPYRKSRGKVLLDTFKYTNFSDFSSDYVLDNIEPFTIICVESTPHLKLSEFRWDGQYRHFRELDFRKPKIWSSSTLYSKEQRQFRRMWFKDWFGQKTFTPNDAYMFHQLGGNHDSKNGILMKRESGPETVSISQIGTEGNGMSFRYSNLISGTDEKIIVTSNFLNYAG